MRPRHPVGMPATVQVKIHACTPSTIARGGSKASGYPAESGQTGVKGAGIQSPSEVTPGECVCYLVLFSRNVQHPEVDVRVDADVHRSLDELIKIWETPQRGEEHWKDCIRELKDVCEKQREHLEAESLIEPIKPLNFIAVIRSTVERLAYEDANNRLAQCRK